MQSACSIKTWIVAVLMLLLLTVIFTVYQVFGVLPEATCAATTIYSNMLLASLIYSLSAPNLGAMIILRRIHRLSWAVGFMLWIGWLVLFILNVHFWGKDVAYWCAEDSAVVVIGALVICWQASILCLGPVYAGNAYVMRRMAFDIEHMEPVALPPLVITPKVVNIDQ